MHFINTSFIVENAPFVAGSQWLAVMTNTMSKLMYGHMMTNELDEMESALFPIAMVAAGRDVPVERLAEARRKLSRLEHRYEPSLEAGPIVHYDDPMHQGAARRWVLASAGAILVAAAIDWQINSAMLRIPMAQYAQDFYNQIMPVFKYSQNDLLTDLVVIGAIDLAPAPVVSTAVLQS